MTYVDTSVLLAGLLAEDRHPPERFWREPLVASRLVEYEVWTRLNAYRLAESHGEAARALLGRLALLELAPAVLSRALEPFAGPVRTLDALHLASAHFLQGREPKLSFATYDRTLASAGRALGLRVVEP